MFRSKICWNFIRPVRDPIRNIKESKLFTRLSKGLTHLGDYKNGKITQSFQTYLQLNIETKTKRSIREYEKNISLYVLVMSRTRFKVNPHSIVA